MPDEVGPALRTTAGDLEGGVPRMGAQAALPVVAGWQRRLEETGHPSFCPSRRPSPSSGFGSPEGRGTRPWWGRCWGL